MQRKQSGVAGRDEQPGARHLERANHALAGPQAGEKTAGGVEQGAVKGRGVVQRQRTGISAAVGETNAERDGAREDAARSQLAAKPLDLGNESSRDDLTVGAGRFKRACFDPRGRHCGAADAAGIHSGGLARQRGARAAGQERQLGIGELRDLPQTPDSRRAQPPRQRRGDAWEHLDLEGGQETRLVAVEHVDDAAGTAQPRRNPRDQLGSGQPERHVEAQRAHGLLDVFRRRRGWSGTGGQADEHFVD